MTYKSKIDVLLFIFIYAIIIGAILPVLIYDFRWTTLVLLVLLLAFITHIVFGIRYIIEGTTLTVKCSVFSNVKYDINEIREIAPTRAPISAIAASLDRLSIKFDNSYTALIVSPKDKQEFVDHLKRINPNIIVKI